jgi:hypothetical protein
MAAPYQYPKSSPNSLEYIHDLEFALPPLCIDLDQLPCPYSFHEIYIYATRSLLRVPDLILTTHFKVEFEGVVRY